MNMIREQGAGSPTAPEEAMTLVAVASARQGAQAMLQAQTVLLASAETLMADWLRRRQEGLSDAHRLLERLHACRDVAAMWDAHHEWMQRAGLRLTADVCSPLATAAVLVNGAVPKGKVETHSATEAARAAA
ncbi:MAG: hypothetical protein WBQ75_09780 [Acetobacteraceae bacterium]